MYFGQSVANNFISLEWGSETASGGVRSLGGRDLTKNGEAEIGWRYEGRTKFEMKIVTFLHLNIFRRQVISIHFMIFAIRNSCLDLNLMEESIGIFLEAKTANRPVIEWSFALAHYDAADVKVVWEWHTGEGVTDGVGTLHGLLTLLRIKFIIF